MKIYTKTGDKGETSLLGGSRVPKYHLRIECYGTVDELNSALGVVRSFCQTRHHDAIFRIQNELFAIGSILASSPKALEQMKLPSVEESQIERLESEIDSFNQELEDLRSFILPGRTAGDGHCHLARTICRRAERRIVELDQSEEVDSLIIKYFNRLSDYLFVLARVITKDAGERDLLWNP